MLFTQEDCIKWFPYIQAIAEGKKVLAWTGWMQKVEPGKEEEYSDNPCHSFTDANGQRFASLKEQEYSGPFDTLEIVRSNHTVVDPVAYYKIVEE